MYLDLFIFLMKNTMLYLNKNIVVADSLVGSTPTPKFELSFPDHVPLSVYPILIKTKTSKIHLIDNKILEYKIQFISKRV